jgi:hypothetical protein
MYIYLYIYTPHKVFIGYTHHVCNYIHCISSLHLCNIFKYSSISILLNWYIFTCLLLVTMYIYTCKISIMFFLLKILLAYNIVHVYINVWHLYVLTIYLRFTPSIVLPLPSSPSLEKFQQISFFYFHKWVQNTSTIFTLTHPLLMPTLTH